MKLDWFTVALVILGISLMGNLIVGCDVNPSKMSQGYADDMASKITYTSDGRTGLCFAIVASRKTGDAAQTGRGLTEVPCGKVQEFIKKSHPIVR